MPVAAIARSSRTRVADAERFARVLADLGGVSPGNAILLKQPRLRELADGLDLLSRRVVEARRAGGAQGGRIEIVVYYWGHADEKGLLLGDDALFVPDPARSARPDSGRRPDRGPGRLLLRGVYALEGRPRPAALPDRRISEHARPRVPDLER